MAFDINNLPMVNQISSTSPNTEKSGVDFYSMAPKKDTAGFDINQLPIVHSVQATEPVSSKMEPTAEPTTASKIATTLGHGALAAIGGISNAAASTLESTANGMGFLLNKLNIISPKTAQQIYKFTDNATKIFKSDQYQPGDIVSQAVNEHPYVATAAAVPTYLAMYGATSVPELGGGFLNTANRVLGNAALTGAQAAGSVASTNPSQMDQAGRFGSILSVGLEPVSAGIGAAVQAMARKPLLKEAITSVSKPLQDQNILQQAGLSVANTVKNLEAEKDAMIAPLKQMPGMINKAQPLEFINSLQQTAKSDFHTKLLADAKDALLNSNNMGDLINARNELNASKQAFFAGVQNNITPAEEKIFNATINNIDTQIDGLAKDNGLSKSWGDFKNFWRDKIIPLRTGANNASDLASMQAMSDNPLYAKQYNKQLNSFFAGFGTDPEKTKALLGQMDPNAQDLAQKAFIKKTFDSLAANPESLNPDVLLKNLNSWQYKMRGVLSPENRQIVSNVQTMLRQYGADTARKTATSSLAKELVKPTLGGLAGAGIAGYQTDFNPKYMLGGAIGGLALQKTYGAIGAFLSTPRGIKILHGIVNGRAHWARDITKTIGAMAPQELVRLYNEDNNE